MFLSTSVTFGVCVPTKGPGPGPRHKQPDVVRHLRSEKNSERVRAASAAGINQPKQLQHNQQLREFSNKSLRIRTYKNSCPQALWNQHLQKEGGGGPGGRKTVRDAPSLKCQGLPGCAYCYPGRLEPGCPRETGAGPPQGAAREKLLPTRVPYEGLSGSTPFLDFT
jgi:hypothetical protein